LPSSSAVSVSLQLATLNNFNANIYKVEVIGYAARASAHDQTRKIMLLAIQNIYILLGPALLAASIYMTLGRIIRAVKGEKHSIIRNSWLTRSFVLGDVLSFIVQGSAAGLMVTGNNVKLGEDIVVAGLCIQVITFGLFAATAIIFQVRMCRYPTVECYNEELPWKQSLYMLYSISALIMVRSISRVVEYSMGQDGYTPNNEWTLYVFDSTLMFIVTIIFWYWYPSKILPQS
jgi:hypothetical protein